MRTANRLDSIKRFYELLDRLGQKTGGPRSLAECNGSMDWPQRGVYFFMEETETRSDSGTGLRVVRVGTHALKSGAKTKLWTRLSQHKGQLRSGGGNHRGSIFRLLVGESLKQKNNLFYPTWGKGNNAPKHIRESELPLEQMVSQHIGNMPFLWLAVRDDAGKESLRGYVEQNSIALLSNYNRPQIDTASDDWLGKWSNRERVTNSGLWNSRHVNEDYDVEFLNVMEKLVESQDD